MALINKSILKNKYFLGALGAFIFFVSSHKLSATTYSATPVLNQDALLSYSGIKMIDLGHHFISELSKEAALWAEKEKDEDNTIVRFISKKEDFSKLIVEGFVNVGQLIFYIGLSKEYENLLKHQNESTYIQARIQIIQDRLVNLKHVLNGRGLDDHWVVYFFEKGNTLSFASLEEKVKVFSRIFKNLHIYGVGFDLASDIPLGSLIGAFVKVPLVKNIANSASYQGAKGVLYFLEKDKAQERNVFVNSSFSHKAAQIKGSVFTGSSGKKAADFNFSVQLTLFASTDELTNFREANLNHAYISELNMANELSEALPATVKGLVGKVLDGLESLLHISFVKEKMKVTMGFITSTNEKLSDNTPDVVISFSIGNQKRSLTTGKVSWLDSSASLGFLSVDRIMR
jgi:hypothetical protein